MDSKLHKQYVDAVAQIEEKLKTAPVSFELTEEEEAALDLLPAEIIEEHEANQARYTSATEYDFREAAWRKFMALILIHADDFRKAYELGCNAGRLT